MGRSHTPPDVQRRQQLPARYEVGLRARRPGACLGTHAARLPSEVRSGRTGPVLLEAIGEITEAECGDYAYRPVRRGPLGGRSGRNPSRGRRVTRRKAAGDPVGSGHFVFPAQRPSWIRVAELLQAPVLTTNPGKSSFPEDHPLALGSDGEFGAEDGLRVLLKEADCVFGAGTSLSRVDWAPRIGPARRMVHLTNDPVDIHKDYFLDAAILADAKLALQALAEEIVARKYVPERDAAAEVAAVRAAWEAEWRPELTSAERRSTSTA